MRRTFESKYYDEGVGQYYMIKPSPIRFWRFVIAWLTYRFSGYAEPIMYWHLDDPQNRGVIPPRICKILYVDGRVEVLHLPKIPPRIGED